MHLWLFRFIRYCPEVTKRVCTAANRSGIAGQIQVTELPIMAHIRLAHRVDRSTSTESGYTGN